jgi:hypothetical protein
MSTPKIVGQICKAFKRLGAKPIDGEWYKGGNYCALGALAKTDPRRHSHEGFNNFVRRIYGGDYVDGFTSAFDGLVIDEWRKLDKDYARGFRNGLSTRRALGLGK